MTGAGDRRILVLVDGETVEPLGADVGPFQIVVAHVRGPGKETCEDAVCAFRLGDESLLLAVVDGMGGMRNGREAARLVVDSLGAQSAAHEAGNSRRAAVVEALERAHLRVTEECPGGGATVVCALVTAEWIQPVHAGDAEALLVGQRGRVKLRTLAHSPVGYAREAGLLSEEEALHHPERHIVSNGIGIDGMSIHVGPRIPLARRDTLVLATDGVTDNAREAEIVDALRRGPAVTGVGALVATCVDRMERAARDEPAPDDRLLGKPDDLTLLALRRRD